MENNRQTDFKQILTRLALLAAFILLMYLIFGDEDQALRNTIRGFIRAFARAL